MRNGQRRRAGRHPKYAAELIRTAIVEYQNTAASSAAVAAKYGISPKYFERLRAKDRAAQAAAGTPEHTPSKPKKSSASIGKGSSDREMSERTLEKLVMIVSLQRDGLNRAQIGRRMGVTGQAIAHLLRIYAAEVEQVRSRLDELVPLSTAQVE